MGKACHACGRAWVEKRSPGFREECACGAALHCCANCRFFDAALAVGCREPAAREQRPRETDISNLCDFFVFSERCADPRARAEAEAERSRRAALEAEIFGAREAEPAATPESADGNLEDLLRD